MAKNKKGIIWLILRVVSFLQKRKILLLSLLAKSNRLPLVSSIQKFGQIISRLYQVEEQSE